MGKPKVRAQKAIEENEFLNDLIDQVNNQNSNNDEEIIDDSASSELHVLTPSTHADDDYAKIDPYISNNIGKSKNNDDDLPTVFAHIKKDIKAPKLTHNQDADKNPEVVSTSNDKTVASIDYSEKPVRENTEQDTAATMGSTVANAESDRTVAVEGARGQRPILQEKVATGALRGTRNGQVYTSLDASLAQSETLKIAQSRIKELEVEIDRLRTENDDLASAGDVVTRRVEDMQIRLHRLEKEKSELAEQSRSEVLILKGNLQYKDSELSKTKAKLDDLDMRIKSDFRKIRVRERELENRLELVRGEKQALMRAKDEKILDLQRKLDQYKSELDLYRAKVQDLNKIMENQHDQMQKTVRALRIALVNLEHEDSSEMQVENSSENDSEDQKKAR